MARVFVTGSSDGLGLMAGRLLAKWGHRVTLHARNEARAADARRALPQAEAVVPGDVASLPAMRSVADQVNELGPYDAVIHNVGVGSRSPRVETADGISRLFAVNVLAPYVLTALMVRPGRLVYVSSGMHSSGDAHLDDAQWVKRRWNGSQAYADSKLFDVMLAFAVARLWPAVKSNAITPGWVATKMGGTGAPDNLALGAVTQSWLAVSDDPGAQVSGRYFYHQKPERAHHAAGSAEMQDRLLDYCANLTGVSLPKG